MPKVVSMWLLPEGLPRLWDENRRSALLFDRWQQVKEGQGQVILLSGEAGIGKITAAASVERPRWR